MKLKAELMDEKAMNRALMRIAHEITEKNSGTDELCLIGILRRGKTLAETVAADIAAIEGVEVPCGCVDVSFYRDDLTQKTESPIVDSADIPFDISGRRVVLVDDVLYTGRTARAAMEALIAYGRPRVIQLAVLIDRGHRELPIRADYVGKNVPTARSEMIEVRVASYDGETKVCLMDTSQQ